MNSNAMKLKQLIEFAKEIGLDESEWFVNMVRRLSAGWNEGLYQKTCDILANYDLRPLLDNTFPVPVSPDDLKAVDGPYKIGTIANTDIEFGLTPLQLRMHGVIGGASGYGKSTLIKILCQQIMGEEKTKVWLIDPKEGGDYRFLARQFQDVLILRPDVIRLNPFNMLKNVPVKVLRESISEVTADSFGVYDASESVITEHVQRVFEEHEQPNMYDFISSVWKEKVRYGGRRAGYLVSADFRIG